MKPVTHEASDDEPGDRTENDLNDAAGKTAAREGLMRASSQRRPAHNLCRSEAAVGKNITLTVDESVLDQVRVIAAKRQTSVDGLVRDVLTNLANAENRTERARRKLLELAEASQGDMGEVTWKREDLHDR